jgi:hypothetical protein
MKFFVIWKNSSLTFLNIKWYISFIKNRRFSTRVIHWCNSSRVLKNGVIYLKLRFWKLRRLWNSVSMIWTLVINIYQPNFVKLILIQWLTNSFRQVLLEPTHGSVALEFPYIFNALKVGKLDQVSGLLKWLLFLIKIHLNIVKLFLLIQVMICLLLILNLTLIPQLSVNHIIWVISNFPIEIMTIFKIKFVAINQVIKSVTLNLDCSRLVLLPCRLFKL